MSEPHILETDGFCYRHHTSYNYPKDAHTAHSHNMYELIYFLEGDATHIIEDRKYKLKKDDLVLIQPSKHHFIQIDSTCNYERYNILFNPHALGIESIHLLGDRFDVINLNKLPMARDIIRKTDYYFKHFGKDEFIRITALLLEELCYLLSITETNDSPEESSPVLSLAISYINENLTTLKDVAEVARHCFVSESYLFRLFKTELHHSPKKYINEKRILLAERMINDGERPTSVYEKCGFTDYTTFYRNYSAFFGRKPSDER